MCMYQKYVDQIRLVIVYIVTVSNPCHINLYLALMEKEALATHGHSYYLVKTAGILAEIMHCLKLTVCMDLYFCYSKSMQT